MERKLFKADPSKKKYTITIEVFENCFKLGISVSDGNPHPSYYDVIGNLDTTKYSLIHAQMTSNMEEFDKLDKPQKKTTKKK